MKGEEAIWMTEGENMLSLQGYLVEENLFRFLSAICCVAYCITPLPIWCPCSCHHDFQNVPAGMETSGPFPPMEHLMAILLCRYRRILW